MPAHEDRSALTLTLVIGCCSVVGWDDPTVAGFVLEALHRQARVCGASPSAGVPIEGEGTNRQCNGGSQRGAAGHACARGRDGGAHRAACHQSHRHLPKSRPNVRPSRVSALMRPQTMQQDTL